jgi:hypothetical protein
MRRVGKRVEPAMEVKTSGASLASNIAFSADMKRLAGGRVFFPKGVYRYKSHEEANAHQSECLAEGMAKLAKERNPGHP